MWRPPAHPVRPLAIYRLPYPEESRSRWLGQASTQYWKPPQIALAVVHVHNSSCLSFALHSPTLISLATATFFRAPSKARSGSDRLKMYLAHLRTDWTVHYSGMAQYAINSPIVNVCNS